MKSINDVNASELIDELARLMKEFPEIKPPAWARFAKTGRFKERPPSRDDWWYVRSASVLRSVHKLGPVGVSKLRTKYGGKKNRGFAAEHTYKGSGSVIRTVLQQLEKAGLVRQAAKGIHKGRTVTPKAQSIMNGVAKAVHSGDEPVHPKADREKPVEKPQKKKEPREKKQKQEQLKE
ncbi:30S ribosomal protein S19e [Candidatus Woesearchaeota archaeon]|nr:30S ribosomal protein S19e [Candidatus Woesearchaeota archaeon]